MNMFKDFFSAKNQSQPDISKDNWDSLSQEELIDLLNKDNLPRHIAIIMDGNGRWAKAHNLPRQMGHRKGAETLRRVLECAQSISVETITVYAFSTENWKRSAEEVGFLMDLLLEYLIKELKTFHEAGIKVIPLGDIDGLPEKVCHEFVKVREDTKNNQKMTLNIAVNYGSRKEIADGIRNIAEKCQKGELYFQDIDEKMFGDYLYTAGQRDPDLLIRPSGELRISNFLLWQLAYAEFYYTPVLWPDFDGKELLKAILHYQKRDRRFGGRNEKKSQQNSEKEV